MRQWRILHTESSLGWGGQEVRVLAELEWMRAHGHWVALAAHPASTIAQRAREAGISVLSAAHAQGAAAARGRAAGRMADLEPGRRGQYAQLQRRLAGRDWPRGWPCARS